MRFRSTVLVSAGLLLVGACSEAPVTPSSNDPRLELNAASQGRYIILGAGNKLPGDLAAKVAAAGGKVESTTPQIGMAVVSSSAAGFREAVAAIGGVSDVMEDFTVTQSLPRLLEMSDADAAVADQSAGLTNDDTFYQVQWAPQAIDAPLAWQAGYRGQGVRVAIIDGGFYVQHVDLAGAFDLSASRSFVPGYNYDQDTGTFWHGTHVAGIIGARGNNGLGVVGIAPEATLIGLKALQGGSGEFSWLIEALVYAATPVSAGGAGAQVVNMSLGAGFLRQGRDAAQLANAVGRATTFAYQNGVAVVAAAGNDGFDLDHTANLIFIPGQSTNVVNVSATGPFGWAINGATDFYRPASYTNYGLSAIDVGAPGGDFAWPGNEVCAKPRQPAGVVVQFCWVFDMVFSTARGSTAAGGYAWAAGTSMASPATAAVAALIIQKNGGPMQPAQVEAQLKKSAVATGKPGNDPYVGRGWINAWNAVR